MTKVFPERHCYDTWIQLGGSGLEPARGPGRPKGEKGEGSGAAVRPGSVGSRLAALPQSAACGTGRGGSIRCAAKLNSKCCRRWAQLAYRQGRVMCISHRRVGDC